MLDYCFWGHKGVSPLRGIPRFHRSLELIHQTWTLFSPLLLTTTFDQMTTKHSLYMQKVLVVLLPFMALSKSSICQSLALIWLLSSFTVFVKFCNPDDQMQLPWLSLPGLLPFLRVDGHCFGWVGTKCHWPENRLVGQCVVDCVIPVELVETWF